MQEEPRCRLCNETTGEDGDCTCSPELLEYYNSMVLYKARYLKLKHMNLVRRQEIHGFVAAGGDFDRIIDGEPMPKEK